MKPLLCTVLLLSAAGDTEIPRSIPGIVEMLSSDPGHERFDCWASRWKVNFFRAAHLCRPDGDPEAHRGYYEGQCEAPAAHRALGRLLLSVDRSPENLRRLWQRHRARAFAALSPGMYQRSGAQITVAALRATYEHAARSAAQRRKLQGVHQAVLELMKHPEKRHPAYGWRWAELYHQAYPELEHDSGVSSAWSLSFWARRIAEGNIDVANELLEEIEAHYQGKHGFEWGENFTPVYQPPVTDEMTAPRLYAIGWSCRGRFAYARANPGNGRAAFADLVVVDLVKDEELLRVEDGVAVAGEWASDGKRDPTLSISPPLREQLRALGVDRPSGQEIVSLPWRAGGVRYSAELRVATTGAGEQRTVVLRRGAREKVVHTWTVSKEILEMTLDRGAHIVGLIPSPCEQRVAVVIAQGYAGHHGPPAGEHVWVVGAHLSAGFESR